MSIEKYRTIIEQADTEETRNGLTWYDRAHAKVHSIAIQNNIEPARVAGIIAVLSPKVEWHLNLKAAENIIKNKSKARGISGFNCNVKKALKVLHGDLNVIQGPKVEPFFRTLLNPLHNEPVIDSHMVAAFYTERTLQTKDIQKIAGTRRRNKLIGAVETLAKENNWSVAQTQAVIWVTYKRLSGPYANQYKLWK